MHTEWCCRLQKTNKISNWKLCSFSPTCEGRCNFWCLSSVNLEICKLAKGKNCKLGKLFSVMWKKNDPIQPTQVLYLARVVGGSLNSFYRDTDTSIRLIYYVYANRCFRVMS